uniref:Uncharacterized protein n=1 Tax=Anguilla anguilla TaxID=7936 RepID=A0A0E9Y108_ANGAN
MGKNSKNPFTAQTINTQKKPKLPHTYKLQSMQLDA